MNSEFVPYMEQWALDERNRDFRRQSGRGGFTRRPIIIALPPSLGLPVQLVHVKNHTGTHYGWFENTSSYKSARFLKIVFAGSEPAVPLLGSSTQCFSYVSPENRGLCAIRSPPNHDAILKLHMRLTRIRDWTRRVQSRNSPR